MKSEFGLKNLPNGETILMNHTADDILEIPRLIIVVKSVNKHTFNNFTLFFLNVYIFDEYRYKV